MDAATFQTLLHTPEGPTLDVKRTSYRLDDAAQKAELVKDVLAFANAWRQTSAYILIGVEEGQPHRVVGEFNHPDDATLQQVVNGDPKNGRCNRWVEFSYERYQAPGGAGEVGVLEIPVQQRPLHLLKRQGALEAKAVYMRLGSSTVVADPDEIARMGEARVETRREPTITVGLADLKKRELLESFAPIRGGWLSEEEAARMPNYNYYDGSTMMPSNRDYFREQARHILFETSAVRLGVVIENGGAEVATGVVLTLETTSAAARFIHPLNVPEEASKSFPLLGSFMEQMQLQKSPLAIEGHQGGWQGTLLVGDLPPGGKRWLTELPQLEVTDSGGFTLHLTVHANNMEKPVAKSYETEALVKQLTAEDCMELFTSGDEQET